MRLVPMPMQAAGCGAFGGWAETAERVAGSGEGLGVPGREIEIAGVADMRIGAKLARGKQHAHAGLRQRGGAPRNGEPRHEEMQSEGLAWP